MAAGDLIFVPTGGNALGFVKGGSAIAYKREASAYGDQLTWDGDVAYRESIPWVLPVTLTFDGGTHFTATPDPPNGYAHISAEQGGIVAGRARWTITWRDPYGSPHAVYYRFGPTDEFMPVAGVYSYFSGADLGTVEILAS